MNRRHKPGRGAWSASQYPPRPVGDSSGYQAFRWYAKHGPQYQGGRNPCTCVGCRLNRDLTRMHSAYARRSR